MTARFAKDQMSFVMPASFSGAQTARGSRRDAGLSTRIAAAVQWFAALSRRHAVVEELNALSDHELADIGLTRGEIGRVFDRRFAADHGAAR